MARKITGSSFIEMIRSGLSNLDNHRATVNDMNVFPVADGDTGTNMVMTIKNGLSSVAELPEDLFFAAKKFANSVVYGARGNSGVIISQFFKGMSEGFEGIKEADPAALARAIKKGCDFAYAAVSDPVEGTILTVIREASDAVNEKIDTLKTVDEVVAEFLRQARASLKDTPKLLPILEKSGVVDSGGSGLVYFFEGVKKYLDGEEIVAEDPIKTEFENEVDYSRFNQNSRFDYGYCTELLIQLTSDKIRDFIYESFVSELKQMGGSLVTSVESDKVKVHIHTEFPEKILAFCHGYGEFLSLKIENMSVQHSETAQKILLSDEHGAGNFAIVAVAPSALLQSMFSEMGADAVILSEEAPSSSDFIEAFELIPSKRILVFPNSSNSILSAMQAGSLYKKSKITVLNCRSAPECYSSLAIVDFDSTDVDSVVDTVNDIIGNIYEVSIARAAKSVQFGNKTIVKNDFIALAGDDVISSGDKIEDVLKATLKEVTNSRECDVITLFYGSNISDEVAKDLSDTAEALGGGSEVCLIPTGDPIFDLTISFE